MNLNILDNMETFKDIINSDLPVLVDFFATWCGPCKTMTPIINDLGKDFHGRARILKIDVDKNQEVSNKYEIKGVPTFIIFKKGKVVWRDSGVMDKSVLVQKLQDFTD